MNKSCWNKCGYASYDIYINVYIYKLFYSQYIFPLYTPRPSVHLYLESCSLYLFFLLFLIQSIFIIILLVPTNLMQQQAQELDLYLINQEQHITHMHQIMRQPSCIFVHYQQMDLIKIIFAIIKRNYIYTIDTHIRIIASTRPYQYRQEFCLN